MTTTPLPPLPETDLSLCFFDEGGAHPCDGDGYTAEQMQTYAQQACAALEAELRQWKNVFGHLGTADECGNEWIALQDSIERKDALLRQALTKLEECHVSIDGEWGHCRELEQIDADGDQWAEVIAIREELAK